jgi:oligosaccharide repeat unit polymerase
VNAIRILLLATLLGLTLLLPFGAQPLVVAGVWLACVAVLARSHPEGILSFACLYLLLLGVFHLGLIVPVALGLSEAAPPPWMSSGALPASLSLVSTAMAAFTMGARLLGGSRRDELPLSLPPRPVLLLAGSVVALLGAGLLWVGGRQAGVFSTGYGEVFQRALTADIRAFNVGMMVFPIGVVVAAVGASRAQMLPLAAAVLAILAPLFLAGFRGPVIVHLATLLAVWARKDVRLARRVALALAAAAVVLVPAVRMTRDTRRDVREGLVRFDPLALFLEAGTSLYPLVVTADRVGSGAEPLWMGRSYALAVARVVPNLGERAGLEGRALTPNGWATLHADRWLYERGGGIGFSGVAEPYLNFGLAGVVVFFFLLGLVMQRWERWLERDPFRAGIAAATFGFVLWTVRNESLELFRSMALATVVVGGALWLHRVLRRRVGSLPLMDDPVA